MVIFTLNPNNPRVQELARKLNLKVVEQAPEDYYLTFDQGILCVKDPRQGQYFSLSVDLLADHKKWVEQKKSYKKNLLCKAVGFKGEAPYRIFDGTLGFAGDAVQLMTYGIEIIGCEQNLIMHSLLEDAYLRSKDQFPNFSLVLGDSFDHLADIKEEVDCLYLDPMFENIKKKSAPKKKMAFLREFEEGSEGVQRVIERGVELGIKRIVVKRPINGDHLYRKPNVAFNGKLVRYDVYIR